jgi:hypothetical protein
MPIRIGKLACIAAWAATSWASTVIAVAQEPVTYYQVKVQSSDVIEPSSPEAELQTARLAKFVQRLRAELMVENLGEANVGCDRCGELVEAEKVEDLEPGRGPVTSLEFSLLRSGAQLVAFARSYEFVQSSEIGVSSFKMEIDGTRPGAGACTQAQLNAGCKTRSLCVQTGGCDKPYGGGCNLCPVQ